MNDAAPWAAANGALVSVPSLAAAQAAGLVERYTSGNKPWRERELGRIIGMCGGGAAAGVIVHDLSRLSR